MSEQVNKQHTNHAKQETNTEVSEKKLEAVVGGGVSRATAVQFGHTAKDRSLVIPEDGDMAAAEGKNVLTDTGVTASYEGDFK